MSRIPGAAVRPLLVVVLLLQARHGIATTTVGDPVAARSAEALQYYEQGRFEEALRAYRDALVENPTSAPLHLNVGDALYQLGDYAGAADEFEYVARAEDAGLAAQGFFNLGNSRFQLQDYAAAAEAYRQALRRSPADVDAKANLELALRMMQPPPPRQGEEERSNSDSSTEDSEPEQADEEGDTSPDGERSDAPAPSQQQPPQPPSSGDAEDRSEKGGPSGDVQPVEDPPPGEPVPAADATMDEAEAERLLDALAQREQEGQKRRFRDVRRTSQEYDW